MKTVKTAQTVKTVDTLKTFFTNIKSTVNKDKQLDYLMYCT